MKTIRTIMAVMLVGTALTAFQSEVMAQTRRGGTSSRSTTTRKVENRTSTNGTSVSRKSSTNNSSKSSGAVRTSRVTNRNSNNKSSAVKTPSTTVRKTTVTQKREKTPTTVKTPVQTTRPTTVTRPATTARPAETTRPVTVTRPATNKPAKEPDFKPGDRNDKPVTVTRPGHAPGNRKPGGPDYIRPNHRPDVHRVHPRDRDFMHYSAPSYYWSGHNHCYGHRVRTLPTHVHRHVHYGVTYYCYNDIWYRPYGGHYVVCRPPFGTLLAAELISDMAWTAVRLSYYYTVANTYSQINDNNRYIAEQNAIIAQNNATIAAQNQAIAMNQSQAQMAYGLASQLGLVQSYAAANGNYFYQDGVFYTMDANGQYKVIVPPAGAIVETLPEDYDMIVLSDGNDYYKVDETIYRIIISEGKPYFEVLGQLYN